MHTNCQFITVSHWNFSKVSVRKRRKVTHEWISKWALSSPSPPCKLNLRGDVFSKLPIMSSKQFSLKSVQNVGHAVHKAALCYPLTAVMISTIPLQSVCISFFLVSLVFPSLLPFFFSSLSFSLSLQTQTKLEHAHIRQLEQSLLLEKSRAESLQKDLEKRRVKSTSSFPVATVCVVLWLFASFVDIDGTAQSYATKLTYTQPRGAINTNSSESRLTVY